MQDKWLSVEEFKKLNNIGWCWIVYKGQVIEAFYYEGIFRFHKTSCNCYMTECITHVKTWDKPELPIKEEY